MTYIELNDRQVITLRAFALLSVIINTVLLIAALHNTIRYLCRLKVTKALILAFYAILIIETLYTITIMTLIIIYPPEKYYTDFFDDFQW